MQYDCYFFLCSQGNVGSMNSSPARGSFVAAQSESKNKMQVLIWGEIRSLRTFSYLANNMPLPRIDLLYGNSAKSDRSARTCRDCAHHVRLRRPGKQEVWRLGESAKAGFWSPWLRVMINAVKLKICEIFIKSNPMYDDFQ